LNAVAQPTAALPARSLPLARPSFVGAVRSELMKIRRQALTWVILAAFVVVSGITLGSVVSGDQAGKLLAHNPRGFYFSYLEGLLTLFDTMSGVLLLILSARLVSMEYGSGTIRMVLARGTGRVQLLGAQFAALAITGLLVLAGFIVVCGGVLYGIVVAWQGSFTPITSLPQVAWTDTWINLLVALVSMAVCILLGAAAAVVGRSVAFGVGAALAFFPADNFGTVVMLLVNRLTHQDIWRQATQYFLGPTLNQVAPSLQTDHVVGAAFATPLVQVDATHCWVVIGVYAFIFLAAAVVLTWRRDVLH
jgi:ABC-2 type transport system permease protein